MGWWVDHSKPPFNESLRRNEPTARQFAGLPAAAGCLHSTGPGSILEIETLADPAGRQSCLEGQTAQRGQPGAGLGNEMTIAWVYSMPIPSLPARPASEGHGHCNAIHPGLLTHDRSILDMDKQSCQSDGWRGCPRGPNRPGQDENIDIRGSII